MPTPTYDILHAKLPAGAYWVADPSYVFGRNWAEKCDEMLDIVNVGVLQDAGHPYVVVADFGGDGLYDGTVKTTEGSTTIRVPVDAGMMGLIPVALSAKAPYRNAATVAFAKPVRVQVERDARGMTTGWQASDGATSVRVGFDED